MQVEAYGGRMPLNQVATITMGQGPAQIQHMDGRRMIAVSANNQGRAQGEVIADGPTADVVVSSPSFAPQVTKILVDARSGNNMLFMPLDRILQQVSQGGAAAGPAADPGASPPLAPGPAPGTSDARTRDANNARSRERETR